MYRIKVEGHFSSAHNLRGYRGKCEALHGHNWKVEAEVRGRSLDKAGMLMDFKILKQALNRLLEKLDHTYLNDVPFFRKVNPTSENIARYIFDSLAPVIKGLVSVSVWENETSRATYER